MHIDQLLAVGIATKTAGKTGTWRVIIGVSPADNQLARVIYERLHSLRLFIVTFDVFMNAGARG